jgi:hypothetical protein
MNERDLIKKDHVDKALDKIMQCADRELPGCPGAIVALLLAALGKYMSDVEALGDEDNLERLQTLALQSAAALSNRDNLNKIRREFARHETKISVIDGGKK